jgi:two-component system, OmpR family, phosphate regulon response regulator PhoB
LPRGIELTMDHKTILIADDDSDLADALAKRCERLGLKTIVAYDGLSTSKTIVERPPDLVCLDLNMPLGSGMDVCRMLAGDASLASIPVIVLTCRCDAETICRCRAMGAHYVLKSADVWERLEPLIEQLLHVSFGDDGGQESVEADDRLPAGAGGADRPGQGAVGSFGVRHSEGI